MIVAILSLLLCMLISIQLVYCYPLEVNQQYEDLPLDTEMNLNDHNVFKKDIFMSRGWGAAGMPSMYYLDKPLKQRRKNREPPKVEVNPEALYRKQLPEIEETNFEALRAPSTEDESRIKLRKQPNPPKNKYTIPQLFVSYGWGPMG